MKQLILSTLLILVGGITSEIQSQEDWMDLPTNNTIWSTHFYAIGEAPEWLPTKTRHLSFDGDTLVNGILYSRLIANMDTVPGPGGNKVLEIDTYVGAVHQENKVVTIIRAGDTELDTLYDFNVNIGDIVATVEDYPIDNCQGFDCPYIQMTSKDTVTLSDGLLRERLNFDVINNGQNRGYSHSIIEGVGSTLGLLNDPTDVLSLILSVQSNHPWRQLLCYENEDALLYTGDEYDGDCNKYKEVDIFSSVKELTEEVSVFPNPVGDMLTVDLHHNVAQKIEYKLIDLSGKMVRSGYVSSPSNNIDMTELRDGIYILKLEFETSVTFLRVMKVNP